MNYFTEEKIISKISVKFLLVVTSVQRAKYQTFDVHARSGKNHLVRQCRRKEDGEAD